MDIGGLGGVRCGQKKNPDVNLNFILHMYGKTEQTRMWGFKGVEEGMWVGIGYTGREMGVDRDAGHLRCVSGVFWRCPRLPLRQPVLGRAIWLVG